MAMYKKILIGYDGSEPCQRAAAHAIALAKEQGAELVGVKVISFSFETIVPSDQLWDAIMEDLRGKASAILDELGSMATEQGMKVKLEVREGDAGEEIAAMANEIGADLIVLAVGSRSSRMGRFLGQGQRRLSIRTIATEVNCPLLLVS